MGSCLSSQKEEKPAKPSVGRVNEGNARTKTNTKTTATSSKNDIAAGPLIGGTISEDVSRKEAKEGLDETTLQKINEINGNHSDLKILLLGSGESGKSTILKQMKILHQNGYTEEELIEYRPFIFKNLLDSAKTLSKCYKDFDYKISVNCGLIYDKEKNGIFEHKDDFEDSHDLTTDDLDLILCSKAPRSDDDFDLTLRDSIAALWKANSTKNMIFQHHNDFYLMDSAKYFFENLNRITSANYIPTVMDVLRTRKKTSGIFETKFQVGNQKIHMIDVGGQRSERKKWINCFDNVSTIIFCISLSEYNQTLLEEKSQNRLEESIELFDSIVNSKWFTRTSIVLFLNKVDIFAEQLPSSPLEEFFPDYKGGNDITKAAKYILWRLKQVNRSGLHLSPHITQATDTNNIKVVFTSVLQSSLENNLEESGLINN